MSHRFSWSLNGNSMWRCTSRCASSLCSSGPSRITSSWICISRLYPSSFSRGHLAICSMASMAMSAAPPWMGVLMEARSACCRRCSSREAASGRLRWRPSSVLTLPFSAAFLCCTSCQARTSGRSLYHRSTVSSASLVDTPKSLARPWAVLPYAMEKLSTLALRRSLANMSLTSAGRSAPSARAPSDPCSSKHFPASIASRMCEYIPMAVREWKSPPASNASLMLTHPAMCASSRSSSCP
mmetsp:Transcript_29160/g.72050  ORF Transcript_29160/g.72050 Transcript_29160/m.72050 type:complete len:240 (-) Transcript_29160:2041-2760(-)